jgi:hypothetical protein
MKLGKLTQLSETGRIMNAAYVKIQKYKEGRARDGTAYAAAQTYSLVEINSNRELVRSKDRNKYLTKIHFLDKKLNVKVSCSCPDYMFRFEYPNTKLGASDIIYGNGDPPTVYFAPGLCKHLIAVRKLIKQRHKI